MYWERQPLVDWRRLTCNFQGENDATTRFTNYEKETIILTSEGGDTYSVYTFNPALKRRRADFSKKYPEHDQLESEDKKLGSQSYVIDKGGLSIRLTAPYSDARRKAASENAKNHGIHVR